MQIIENTDNLSAFLEKCKKHNLKITPQRITIYRSLIGAKDHPTADVIFKKVKEEFPYISFDTVNRSLITFSEIGIINIVEGHGDPRRFDPNLENHHHFYCIKCGEITDFYNEKIDRLKIPTEIEEEFTITNKRLVLKGYCNGCNKSL